MPDPKKDIERLQREIDHARSDADRAFKGEPPKPVLHRQSSLGLDAVLTGAGMLVVLGLSVSLASELTKDQATALTAGSVGAAGGLVIGYSVGRKRRSSWRSAAEGSLMGSIPIPNRLGSVAKEWGLLFASSRRPCSSSLRTPYVWRLHPLIKRL